MATAPQPAEGVTDTDTLGGALRRTAARLTAGHRLLLKRLGAWAKELGQPRSAAARYTVLGVIAYLAGSALLISPHLMWPATLGYLYACWRVTRPLPPDHRRQLLEGVLHLIGDRPGIHLAELYPALRNTPSGAGLTDPAIRAALQTAGLTIHKSVRIGDATGRSGIKRSDVQALLDAPPSPEKATPSETGVDAGQPPAEVAVEQP
ncbi:hypothetical protein EES44_07850 [Streptomyces sp. ADI96-15]|uniref:hypothetical protein n=1 Tax=Streptomyces sp. ADI96-15 TaxID=1522761 RepID=UPI000F54C81D|nr:hypothetical protein [Streptomyces sp. ADI96-15]RPK69034.1 hypothetical protein EES44_07850 [Streptomyces sp. ADI96-15]